MNVFAVKNSVEEQQNEALSFTKAGFMLNENSALFVISCCICIYGCFYLFMGYL
ncbi:MAG: hypothetical protein ABGX32_03645 [Methylococcales bacterium]